MNTQLLSFYVTVEVAARTVAHRLGEMRDERGEGVISAAIAVLIVAGIGILAYQGFRAIFQNTETKINAEISQIGS